MSNNLLHNLKQFRRVEAEAGFKASLGERLRARSEVYKMPVVDEVPVFGGWKRYFQVHSLARVTAVAMCVLLVAGGGSILTVSAAQNSLPGDFLYGIKIVKEKVQTAVVTSPEAKVKLKIAFAGNRLEEAKVLAVKNGPDASAKIAQAVKGFEQEMAAAAEHLDKIKEGKGIVKIEEPIVADGVVADPSTTIEVIVNQTTTLAVADELVDGQCATTTEADGVGGGGDLAEIGQKIAAYQTTLDKLKTEVDLAEAQEDAGQDAVAEGADNVSTSDDIVINPVDNATGTLENVTSGDAVADDAENASSSEAVEVKKLPVRKPAIKVKTDLPTPERSDNVGVKLDVGQEPTERVE